MVPPAWISWRRGHLRSGKSPPTVVVRTAAIAGVSSHCCHVGALSPSVSGPSESESPRHPTWEAESPGHAATVQSLVPGLSVSRRCCQYPVPAYPSLRRTVTLRPVSMSMVMTCVIPSSGFVTCAATQPALTDVTATFVCGSKVRPELAARPSH